MAKGASDDTKIQNKLPSISRAFHLGRVSNSTESLSVIHIKYVCRSTVVFCSEATTTRSIVQQTNTKKSAFPMSW